MVSDMSEQALQQYLIKQYPKEDEGCEWKEFKNLKNDISGHDKDNANKKQKIWNIQISKGL